MPTLGLVPIRSDLIIKSLELHHRLPVESLPSARLLLNHVLLLSIMLRNVTLLVLLGSSRHQLAIAFPPFIQEFHPYCRGLAHLRRIAHTDFKSQVPFGKRQGVEGHGVLNLLLSKDIRFQNNFQILQRLVLREDIDQTAHVRKIDFGEVAAFFVHTHAHILVGKCEGDFDVLRKSLEDIDLSERFEEILVGAFGTRLAEHLEVELDVDLQFEEESNCARVRGVGVGSESVESDPLLDVRLVNCDENGTGSLLVTSNAAECVLVGELGCGLVNGIERDGLDLNLVLVSLNYWLRRW